MLEKDKANLSKYRIEKARECLRVAEYLLTAEEYLTVLNRTYYAIFHAVRAILALDSVDRTKHSGVISYFQQNYVKTGVFEKEFSKIVQDAFEVRQESDYEDFYVISKEDAIMQYENAKKFVIAAEEYINSLN